MLGLHGQGRLPGGRVALTWTLEDGRNQCDKAEVLLAKVMMA